MEETEQPAQKKSRRTPIIVAVVALALVAGGLGTWYALSRPAGVQRADVLRLDKQRAIVDNSMNIYDPLVQEFTARYTSAVSTDADEDEVGQVLQQQRDVLERESATNKNRLEAMTGSPALQESEVKDAVGQFKDKYGAVVAYNDQRLTNTANITQSVGGACAPLHRDLNIGSETYAKDYVSTADACLAALSDAKNGSDAETSTLLGAFEGVIRGQRDKQQEVLDAKDDFERAAKRTLAAIALLDINDSLDKPRTEYENAVKKASTTVVNEANESNANLERILKERLERFDAAGQEGK
ncbi:hypothetical protein ACIPY3_11590 [Paenarthrobacter sp. NPDC089714]|uniref:hypothetical protein n=1 Tax=Paenarthrobacter sp. NPDC089714 TaxID=3364377 RepID=UPI0037F4327C